MNENLKLDDKVKDFINRLFDREITLNEVTQNNKRCTLEEKEQCKKNVIVYRFLKERFNQKWN